MKLFLVAAFLAAASLSDAAPSYRQNVQPSYEGDGSYQFSFQTGDGISSGEGLGQTGNTDYEYITWITPERQVVTLHFVADENGFSPRDPLATPPPGSRHIARNWDTIRTPARVAYVAPARY